MGSRSLQYTAIGYWLLAIGYWLLAIGCQYKQLKANSQQPTANSQQPAAKRRYMLACQFPKQMFFCSTFFQLKQRSLPWLSAPDSSPP